jgi:hypothetical protein
MTLNQQQDPTPYDELADRPPITAADKMLSVLEIPITDVNRRAMMTGISYALRHIRDVEFPPRMLLQECPFCGHVPDPRNYVESIHPVNKSHTAWVATCLETESGCGAQMNGSTRDEVVSKWNTRAYKKPTKRWMVTGSPDEPMRSTSGGSEFLVSRFDGHEEDGTGI